MTGTTPVIRIAGLTKLFGNVRALNGLDLTVDPGEVHGFLGPNGAGKSTTIRVLLGLMRATSGHVELFGGDPWHDAPSLHGRLAYVAGDVALWPGLTGGQCLDIVGATHLNVDERRRAELIERFELDPTKRIRDYSKGNRQKVALIAALAAEVELLILDEPTSGLDPLMAQVFQDCIHERREDGATVLLSSQIMGEVESLADRVSLIRRGRTVTSGTLAELRRHTRTAVHAVTAASPGNLADAPGVTDHHSKPLGRFTESRLRIDSAHLDEVIGRIHAAGIHTLTVTPPSLGELFLRSYGEALDVDEASSSPDEATDEASPAQTSR